MNLSTIKNPTLTRRVYCMLVIFDNNSIGLSTKFFTHDINCTKMNCANCPLHTKSVKKVMKQIKERNINYVNQ